MIGENLFKNCIVYGDDHVVAQLEGWPHSRVFHHIFFKRIHWSMQGAPPGLIIYLRTVDLGKSCHSKVCKYQIITPYFRLRTSLIFPKNSVLVKSLLILNLPCHNQENIGEILLVKSRNVLCLNLNSIVQVDTWYIMQIK